MKNIPKLVLLMIAYWIAAIVMIMKIPKIYLTTVIFSLVTKAMSDVVTKIRTKELGYSVCKVKNDKLTELLFLVGSFIPIANVITSSLDFLTAYNTNDNNFLKIQDDKLIPFRETKNLKQKEKIVEIVNIKEFDHEESIRTEYKGISKHEYKLAKKMEEVESFVDEIMLNVNLNKDAKIELLKQMRKEVYLTGNVRMNDKKMLRLSKDK